jgi:hypothetical protein
MRAGLKQDASLCDEPKTRAHIQFLGSDASGGRADGAAGQPDESRLGRRPVPAQAGPQIRAGGKGVRLTTASRRRTRSRGRQVGPSLRGERRQGRSPGLSCSSIIGWKATRFPLSPRCFEPVNAWLRLTASPDGRTELGNWPPGVVEIPSAASPSSPPRRESGYRTVRPLNLKIKTAPRARSENMPGSGTTSRPAKLQS